MKTTMSDLLLAGNITPQRVLALRHRPSEPELNKVLPMLAARKPEVFNAYQQTQGEAVEKKLTDGSTDYVASFIARGADKALFVGLYRVVGRERITRAELWQKPFQKELPGYGMRQPANESDPQQTCLWFDLRLTDFCAEDKGKLVVDWPSPRNWHRRPNTNMKVHAILEHSALDVMPKWNELSLNWDELAELPGHWRSELSHWRGIYYIFDTSDGKGYVGSAYGKNNLLGRWMNYTKGDGDGGNILLKGRDSEKFQFTILERVSPDQDAGKVVWLEATWKKRLHTYAPSGLNNN